MFRRLAAVVLLSAVFAAPATSALADDPAPTVAPCDQVWSQYCSDPGTPGIPGAFVFFAVLAGLAGVGLTMWRVSTARKLAREAGLDPGRATAVTLLGNDGLDATYVASAVRTARAPQEHTPAPRVASDAESRLRELARLHETGLVTDEEYERRRAAVIDAV